MWLLEHWLNATFEFQLGFPMLERIMCLNQDRPIEGVRLALMTCQETPNKNLFMKYLSMFIKANYFVPGMDPFVDRSFGPKWFKNPFPGDSPQVVVLSSAVWREFFTTMMLSFRIEAGSKGYGFMSYQPNLVARQFGLSQMLPKSSVSHSTDNVWTGRPLDFKGHKACLKFHKSTQRLELPAFEFQQSFLTNKEFDEWWFDYQRQCFPSSFFLQNMNGAFSILVGETPAPQPNTDAPIKTIQTIDVDDAQMKKVTIVPSLFLSFKSKIITSLSLCLYFLWSKDGSSCCANPNQTSKKTKSALNCETTCTLCLNVS